MKELKKIGKCKYCKDPIYDSQETDETGHYHAGCKKIEEEELAVNP